jgi:hypothetical protein
MITDSSAIVLYRVGGWGTDAAGHEGLVHAIVTLIPDPEARALAHELHIPRWRYLVRLHVSFRDWPPYQDYRLEYIALPFPFPPDAGGTLHTWAHRATGEALRFRVWRTRIWPNASPLYGELVWRVDGHTFHISGWDPRGHSDKALRAVATALRFLAHLRMNSTRPKDTGDYRAGEDAVFLADLMPHIQTLVDADTEVNYRTVSTAWGHDRGWVRKYCDLFHLNLGHLADEYRRRRGGQL